jgi:hypothetical protein
VTADDSDGDTFNDYVNSRIFNVDNDNAFYDVQFLNGTRHSNLALNAVVINNNILAVTSHLTPNVINNQHESSLHIQ